MDKSNLNLDEKQPLSKTEILSLTLKSVNEDVDQMQEIYKKKYGKSTQILLSGKTMREVVDHRPKNTMSSDQEHQIESYLKQKSKIVSISDLSLQQKQETLVDMNKEKLRNNLFPKGRKNMNNVRDGYEDFGEDFLSESSLSFESSDPKNKEEQIMQKLIAAIRKKDQTNKKKGITDKYLSDIFARSKSLMEEIWKEMDISKIQQEKFSKKHFYPETRANFIAIFKEISKLCKIRSIQHQILKCIEQREVLLQRVEEITKELNGKRVEFKSVFQFEQTEENFQKYLLKDPRIRLDLPSIFVQIRKLSIRLVDHIQTWRNSLEKKQSFEWNGINYLLKMQKDLNCLKMSEIAHLFHFPVESNPLLIPEFLRYNHQNPKEDPEQEQSLFKTRHFSKNILEEEEMMEKKSNPVLYLQSKVDPSKKKKYYMTPDILTLSVEEIKEIKRAEKTIFREKSFIEKLKEDEMKEKAAIKIQCAFRGHLARKKVEALLVEQNYISFFCNERAKLLAERLEKRKNMEQKRNSENVTQDSDANSTINESKQEEQPQQQQTASSIRKEKQEKAKQKQIQDDQPPPSIKSPKHKSEAVVDEMDESLLFGKAVTKVRLTLKPE